VCIFQPGFNFYKSCMRRGRSNIEKAKERSLRAKKKKLLSLAVVLCCSFPKLIMFFHQSEVHYCVQQRNTQMASHQVRHRYCSELRTFHARSKVTGVYSVTRDLLLLPNLPSDIEKETHYIKCLSLSLSIYIYI
jgi:hypothetical protein